MSISLPNRRRATLYLLAAAVVAVFALSLSGREWLYRGARSPAPGDDGAEAGRPPAGDYRRIVSLAPSLTETLYALELGDRVVGVTRFCRYPPEVADKPEVGGFLDPNLETIVALEPDLVVMLTEHKASPALAELGPPCLVVSHKTVDDIVASIETIGRTCRRKAKAAKLADEIRATVQRVARLTADLPQPSVLVAVDRPRGTGRIEDVYVAGNDGFFSRIIELAGGRNALADDLPAFPAMSAEGILEVNPEVIIDLTPNVADDPASAEAALADWAALEEVAAVANDRVHVLRGDYVSVPGPRFVLLLEDLARLLHPEAAWDDDESPPS